MLLNRVPCWANESMLGVRMRRYPYELKWSARRVSIEIRMTEVGSAARHNPAVTPSSDSHRKQRITWRNLRFWNHLPRVHKRHRHNHRARRATGRTDFQLRAQRRVRHGNHGVTDIFL